jgi:hypothetical protein
MLKLNQSETLDSRLRGNDDLSRYSLKIINKVGKVHARLFDGNLSGIGRLPRAA